MPIYTSSSILNYTQLLITKDAGTLEVYYYGMNLEKINNGFIYIYESPNLKNFSHILAFPSETIKFSTNASELTLLYFGPSSNNIVVVSRIKEYHSENCDTVDNVDIVPVNGNI
jgi:hypothetical protein